MVSGANAEKSADQSVGAAGTVRTSTRGGSAGRRMRQVLGRDERPASMA